MTAITRLGLHGGPRGLYGSFANKTPGLGVILDVPFAVDEDDDSVRAADGTAGSETSLDTGVYCRGGGSWHFTGDGNVTTNAVQFDRDDVYALGGATTPFIIEGHVLLDDLTDANQQILSFYHHTTNDRVWFLRRLNADIGFFYSDDGTAIAPAATVSRTVNWVVNIWNHVAVSRDSSGDIRIFFNGAQQGASFNPGFAFHVPVDNEARLRFGSVSSTSPLPLSGNLGGWKITPGSSYTADFTPPPCIRVRFNEGFRRNVGKMMR